MTTANPTPEATAPTETMTDAQAKQRAEITKGLPRYKGWYVQHPDHNSTWWDAYAPDRMRTISAATKTRLHQEIRRAVAAVTAPIDLPLRAQDYTPEQTEAVIEWLSHLDDAELRTRQSINAEQTGVAYALVTQHAPPDWAEAALIDLQTEADHLFMARLRKSTR